MSRRRRRTKIIATMGPASDGAEVLDQIIDAGADCLRLNCSHNDDGQLRAQAQLARDAARRAGRPVALLFDLQGPKIRLEAEVEERQLEQGEKVILSGPGGRTGDLRVALEGFPRLVSDASEIIIGDGSPRLQVLASDDRIVEAVVCKPGKIGPRKGVSVTNTELGGEALTPKDRRDLDTAISCDADFIALSFVRCAGDVEQLRERLEAAGSEARVIAKIEKLEAFEKLDEILEAADGIMVARGDLGVEAGFARLPLIQKETIRRAGQQGKVVITATQMLESMISSPLPTRAEATDVANAIFDGSSAVMLSAETAIGDWPVASVSAMAQLALEAEADPSIYCLHLDESDLEAQPATAVMHAAVTLGRDVDAEVIVVPTSSGGSVRAAAKYRPKRPIVALAHEQRVANQLALEWGVYPGLTNWVSDLEEMIEAMIDRAMEVREDLEPGRLAVVSAGPVSGASGKTNLLTLRELPAAGETPASS